MKIVTSVPVQSFVYNVKRTGHKTLPCLTPVEMDRSPDNTPLSRTNYCLRHKKIITQMTNFRQIPNRMRYVAKRYGFIAINAEKISKLYSYIAFEIVCRMECIV